MNRKEAETILESVAIDDTIPLSPRETSVLEEIINSLVSDWISVEDRVPETGGSYIVSCFYEGLCVRGIVDKAHWNPGWSTVSGNKNIAENVTHWQHLPSPPEA